MSKIYNEMITKDNIQDFAECMAVCATRGLARTMGKYAIHKPYVLLITDIRHKDEIGYIIPTDTTQFKKLYVFCTSI